MVVSPTIHIGQVPDPTVLDALADFVCGDDAGRYPVYRSSTFLTQFFQSIGINAVHDGSTRKWWVVGVLNQLDAQQIEKVILRLVDLREYKGDRKQLGQAVRSMNDILAMEGLCVEFQGTLPHLKRAGPIELDAEELSKPPAPSEEVDFLERQFVEDIRISELGLDSVITGFLQERVDEIQAMPRSKAPLGTIILLGSTLEGLILALALEHPKEFMSSGAAPSDKTGKTKKLYDWSLNEFINVGLDIRLIDVDVAKFSHALRDFRNYIHPYHQMSQSFSPDQHTVDICWQVFKAAYSQLKNRASKVLK
ncbi:MAG TPA: hypothetical protein VFW52_02370 [Candidatus Saccharimonadales bacterium]|nr:hypothetical protein [Candidatus Saccharimonadales bacterium]